MINFFAIVMFANHLENVQKCNINNSYNRKNKKGLFRKFYREIVLGNTHTVFIS